MKIITTRIKFLKGCLWLNGFPTHLNCSSLELDKVYPGAQRRLPRYIVFVEKIRAADRLTDAPLRLSQFWLVECFSSTREAPAHSPDRPTSISPGSHALATLATKSALVTGFPRKPAPAAYPEE